MKWTSLDVAWDVAVNSKSHSKTDGWHCQTGSVHQRPSDRQVRVKQWSRAEQARDSNTALWERLAPFVMKVSSHAVQQFPVIGCLAPAPPVCCHHKTSKPHTLSKLRPVLQACTVASTQCMPGLSLVAHLPFFCTQKPCPSRDSQHPSPDQHTTRNVRASLCCQPLAAPPPHSPPDASVGVRPGRAFPRHEQTCGSTHLTDQFRLCPSSCRAPTRTTPHSPPASDTRLLVPCPAMTHNSTHQCFPFLSGRLPPTYDTARRRPGHLVSAYRPPLPVPVTHPKPCCPCSLPGPPQRHSTAQPTCRRQL